ncbi:MAG: rod-binding protein [bacterium]
MSDFIGDMNITLKTEIAKMDNTVRQAEIQAKKTEKTSKQEYLSGIKEVSQEFESIFLGYLLQQMNKTVPENPLFGKSTARDIFTDMHHDNLAKEMAKSGGIGLASIIYNQLSKMPPPTDGIK